ncbi:MAG: peptidoglycan editing factor PgeF [Lachnospiraceae bacterium]|nr:peptidoglycan editing factor PgeF [Lachnospiraceae bacterium]
MNRLPDYPQTLHLTTPHGVPLLQFPCFQDTPFLTHCFTTRLGGVSTGIYESMNFKEDGDDLNENIRANYRIIAQALDVDVTKMVRPSLVHGTQVHEVREEDFGVGALLKSTLTGIDALITNIPGVTLVATFADCVPLYFVDVKHRAIGLAHSGWKGSCNKIALSVLDAMQAAYDTEPEDILAAIGPCICGDCYEVGAELDTEFQKGFAGKIEEQTGIRYREAIMRPGKRSGKYQLDLRQANLQTFLHAGIPREQIAVADICTCCNPQLIFSHRATNGKRGASAAFLGLK